MCWWRVRFAPPRAAISFLAGRSPTPWIGNATLRPLPRREYSGCDDYDLLVGTHRHTVFVTGWLHGQESLKRVMREEARGRALAKAHGLDRYAEGYDFSAGDAYIEATGHFWAAVRRW